MKPFLLSLLIGAICYFVAGGASYFMGHEFRPERYVAMVALFMVVDLQHRIVKACREAQQILRKR